MVAGLKMLYVVTSLEPPDGRDGASFARYLQPVPHTQALNQYLREQLTCLWCLVFIQSFVNLKAFFHR